jgi:membrane protein implicated in regulation of membrane protease activity
VSTTDPHQLESIDLVDEVAPPVGEEIHLPGGSILPLAVAVGVTLTVIGTTIWWVWSLVGFVIFVVATVLWVRDTRRDVDALPEDHHHH